MDDITKIDLYELLNILSSATTEEVKKAYRKNALKCHPDKNPENPRAAELFHQLSKALEILTDDSARAAYDKVINAKKAAILRDKELDSKRKKLKEDLEAREKQAQFDIFKEKSAEGKLKTEIERLHKEGSKQLEEEIEFVRQQVLQEKLGNLQEIDPSLYRLKLTWTNITDNVYNDKTLNKIFSKYGDITALVVSNKKKCSALLEFTSASAAVKAQRLERGFISNPLTVSWLSGTPPGTNLRQQSYSEAIRNKVPVKVSGTSIFSSVMSDKSVPTQCNTFPCFSTDPDKFIMKKQDGLGEDFESLVLSRMRKAEEEKRKAEKENS